MTRNQKIALGCGGAGCLGLIVVVVAGCLIWVFYNRSPRERYDVAFDSSANSHFANKRDHIAGDYAVHGKAVSSDD